VIEQVPVVHFLISLLDVQRCPSAACCLLLAVDAAAVAPFSSCAAAYANTYDDESIFSCGVDL